MIFFTIFASRSSLQHRLDHPNQGSQSGLFSNFVFSAFDSQQPNQAPGPATASSSSPYRKKLTIDCYPVNSPGMPKFRQPGVLARRI